MNGWQCVASNPVSGVSTWVKEEDDGLLVQTRQDVSALLDKNMAQRNVAANHWRGDYHCIAALPLEMMHSTDLGRAIQEGDDSYVDRFLNDGDNSKLRTKEGRV